MWVNKSCWNAYDARKGCLLTASLSVREFLKTLPDGGVKVEELVYRLRTAVSRLSEAHHLAGVLSNATHERTVPCPVRGTTLVGCGGGGGPCGGEACLDPVEAPNQVGHVSLNRCIKPGGSTSPKVCELGAGVRKVGNDGDKLHNDGRLVQVINNNDNNRVQDCFAESTNEQMCENVRSHMIGGRLQVDGPEPSTDGVSPNDDALIERLNSVHLSNGDHLHHLHHPGSAVDDISQVDASGGSNPFVTFSQKSHFIEVIENRRRNPCCRKEQFRPHSSPGTQFRSLKKNWLQSLERVVPVTPAKQPEVQESLAAMTSAHLPPLHNAPAKILSLEEAAALLQKQRRRQQELQMNLAAAKLSEHTNIHMDPFEANLGKNSCYRDAHLQQEEDEDEEEEDVEREDYN